MLHSQVVHHRLCVNARTVPDPQSSAWPATCAKMNHLWHSYLRCMAEWRSSLDVSTKVELWQTIVYKSVKVRWILWRFCFLASNSTVNYYNLSRRHETYPNQHLHVHAVPLCRTHPVLSIIELSIKTFNDLLDVEAAELAWHKHMSTALRSCNDFLAPNNHTNASQCSSPVSSPQEQNRRYPQRS